MVLLKLKSVGLDSAYVYMCTNYVIIFNNQSTVLFTVRCLHDMSRTLHSSLLAILIIR